MSTPYEVLRFMRAIELYTTQLLNDYRQPRSVAPTQTIVAIAIYDATFEQETSTRFCRDGCPQPSA